MGALIDYGNPANLPGSEAGRIGRLLGINEGKGLNDIVLARRIASGLEFGSAEALEVYLGRSTVVGPVIPEATWRRAKNKKKHLSREMSERLYEISRVLDTVSRTFHGDAEAIASFMSRPHRLLDGETPLDMARSSSAGADAVMNLLRRADAGFAV